MKYQREKIITAIIISLFVFALFSVIVFSTTELNLSAKSAALYEPESGRFLYKKNSSAPLAMASTTKIMTALVALENSSPEELVTTPAEACGIEGSSLYLKEGETFFMKDLLLGLMLRSANDAAEAIAYHISGSTEDFATLMNNKARELKLSSTNFKNPHGLDDPEHYTTAEELAIITAEALKNPLFKQIVSTKRATVTNTAGESRIIVNHNKLLSMYDGAYGVKTGFTKRSGRSLVGAAEKDGLSFITVTINAPDDWSDHIKMFDFGFSTLEKRVVAEKGQFSHRIPVVGGEGDFVRVTNEESFSVIVGKDSEEVTTHVRMHRYLAAPIKKGDVVGTVIFTMQNKTLGKINIIAEEDVNTPKKKGFFSIF